MAKKTKKVGNTLPKNKNIEERLSEAFKIVIRANKVLDRAEVFIKMQELAGILYNGASFLERYNRTIDPKDLADLLYGIANTIETAMEV